MRYELIACGFRGHVLVGVDAAAVDDEDAVVVREAGGLRWHRCLRCDTWIPHALPQTPATDRVPSRDDIEVPLRGRPLRDRFVLRLIAVDRIVHFLLVGILAVAVLVFAHDRERLRGSYTRLLNRAQAVVGGPLTDTGHGLLHDLDRLFTVPASTLLLYGAALMVYALLNAVEAVGLWFARRWAEYLTFVEVIVFVPVEIHELLIRVSPLKVVALLVNLAVAVYLLIAHRLFGLRGGGRADRAEKARDTGWTALERTAPPRPTTR